MATSRGPVKRNRRGQPRHQKSQQGDKQPTKPVDENSFVIQSFRRFQEQLDNKHDKHERLVKLSRDITIESKRTIFLLHRVHSASREDILNEAETKIKDVNEKFFRKIAAELQGEDPYQFVRAYSPGLQEYIESVSFWKYLKTGEMVTLDEIQKGLVFNADAPSDQDQTPEKDVSPTTDDQQTNDQEPEKVDNGNEPPQRQICVFVPPTEYILGIADLGGELMRHCINGIGNGDTKTPFHLVTFMQCMCEGYQSFGNLGTREVTRKLTVLRQSLKKVENACYTLQVRGSEIPEHMLIDVISGSGKLDVAFQDDNE
ncbi:translin-associated protein X-like [Glandiceps talaboti]